MSESKDQISRETEPESLTPNQKGLKKIITGLSLTLLGGIGGAIGVFINNNSDKIYDDIKLSLGEGKVSQLEAPTEEWVLVGKEIKYKLGEFQEFEEQLTLSISDRKISGKGKLRNSEQDYSGFINGEYIVLSYGSPKGEGIGTVTLKEKSNGLREEFVGTWKGKDCTVRKIVECPAILVKGKLHSSSVTNSKQKYSTLLNGNCLTGEGVAC